MSAATIKQLCEAVSEMDSMSQTAFGEIATLAKLALMLMETPKAYQDPDTLACVFNAIWGKAKDAENYINCMAEGVACNYQDPARQRRYDAIRKAGEIARGEVKA